MIIEIICGIILVLAAAFVANTIDNLRKKNSSKISFKESLELTTLPIVTFYSGNIKLNLLLDTGSNDSFLNIEAVPKNSNLISCDQTEVIGVAIDKIFNKCNLDLYYNTKVFNEEFNIVDLSESIKSIKDNTGVQMHGILGSNFFTKYKYILDFDTMIFYNRQ